MNWQQIATFIFLFSTLAFSTWAYRLASQKTHSSEKKKPLKLEGKKVKAKKK